MRGGERMDTLLMLAGMIALFALAVLLGGCTPY